MRRPLASLALALGACGAPAKPASTNPLAACPQDRAILLAGPDDVAAFAACTSAKSIVVKTGGPLDLRVLTALTTISGDLTIGPSVGLERVELPELTSIGGTLQVGANGNVRGVALPRLASVGRIEIDSNVDLRTVALPQLASVAGTVLVTQNPDLELFDVRVLASIGHDLVLADNRKLALLEARALAHVSAVRIDRNPSLPDDIVAALAALAPPP